MLANSKKSLTASVAIGAVAAVLVGAGGYWAQAAGPTAGQGRAVNSAPVSAPASAPASGPGSFADIIERVAPAVVSIDVEGKAGPARTVFQGGDPFGGDNDDENGGDGRGNGNGDRNAPFPFNFRQMIPHQATPQPMRATGSGFFISREGYILTNNHVVENADKITVRTKDDRSLPAKLVGRDPATDLAVIKVDGSNFPYVSFEDRAKPRVGDWVVALGNPYDLGGTATAGIVSALGRANVSGSSYVDYMQIDAPINQGNSGGPTFDMYGRVVGVNSAIFTPTGGSVGIGFDIPADVAASISRQLIADGKVTRGYLGAQIQTISPDIAASLGIAEKQGALVDDLTPGGPAEAAGLKPGDIVMRINDHPVVSAEDLTRQVGLAHGGDIIHLDVRRDGQMREIAVKSGIRPTEASLAAGAHGGSDEGQGPSASAARILGLSLLPHEGGGLTVQNISSSSQAAESGLQPGDVITQANGHDANAVSDLSAAVAEAKKAGRKSVLLRIARGGTHLFVPLDVNDAAG